VPAQNENTQQHTRVKLLKAPSEHNLVYQHLNSELSATARLLRSRHLQLPDAPSTVTDLLPNVFDMISSVSTSTKCYQALILISSCRTRQTSMLAAQHTIASTCRETLPLSPHLLLPHNVVRQGCFLFSEPIATRLKRISAKSSPAAAAQSRQTLAAGACPVPSTPRPAAGRQQACREGTAAGPAHEPPWGDTKVLHNSSGRVSNSTRDGNHVTKPEGALTV
jgi:hypothetical protein